MRAKVDIWVDDDGSSTFGGRRFDNAGNVADAITDYFSGRELQIITIAVQYDGSSEMSFQALKRH